MNDRELLEKAAKAAGHQLVWGDKWDLGGDLVDLTDMAYIRSSQPDESDVYWDPLEDDGDALRLAVRLALTIQCACIDDYGREYVRVDHYPNSGEPATVSVEEYGCDEAATRRAIVRAAAAMGEQHE